MTSCTGQNRNSLVRVSTVVCCIKCEIVLLVHNSISARWFYEVRRVIKSEPTYDDIK